MKPLLRSLDTLLAGLPPDEGIVVHSGAAHPTVLAQGLAQAAESLQGRTVYTLMPSGKLPYAEPPARDALDLTTFLAGAGMRRPMDAGAVRPLRLSLSAIPACFQRREFRVGAVLVRVSPPDAAGYVSLGVSVDYMLHAIQAARFVLAEIDPSMPRTLGNTQFPASRIDAFVDAIDPPHAVEPAVPDPTDEAIAGHVASLVVDGAVLQLGVGSLPDLVLEKLTHHRHLGLHTGIVGDGARELIERGVIDNSTKTEFVGVSVATMALGTGRFYSFLDGNPLVELHPCSLTHSREVLGRVRTLHAVNSALQIDLCGTVNAERIGGRRVASPGGLPDFAGAASRLPDGKSIIALRAVGRDGRSNIVARIEDEESRSLEFRDVDFFVTEFGVASVANTTPEQRRRAILAVADPAQRAGLDAAAAVLP